MNPMMEAYCFSPCKYGAHSLAVSVDNPGFLTHVALAGAIGLTHPIDAIIKSVSVPIFTSVHHFRDRDKNASFGWKILYHVSLPFKLIVSLFGSGGLLLDQIIKWPFQTVHCFFLGTVSSKEFFSVRNFIAEDPDLNKSGKFIDLLPSKEEFNFREVLVNRKIIQSKNAFSIEQIKK